VTTVRTSAGLRLRADGTVSVEPFIRLDGNTGIHCFTYDDQAPVLVVDSANVRLSLTVPDVDQVTEQDIKFGRTLADAVARYVAELEQRAVTTQDAAAQGQAA
jgi:hypothetical protein